MLSWINKFGLTTKIVVLAVVMLLAVLAVNYVIFLKGYRADMESAMAEKAAAFTAAADEAKNHTGKLFMNGAIDVNSLVAEAQEHVAEGGHYSETPFFEAIPVVAGWTAAGDAAAREGLEFDIVAFDARNKDNQPERSTFEGELLADLESQLASGGEPFMMRVNKETNTLHYQRAIELNNSCMMCHGLPGDPMGDPDGDGKDPLGFTMEQWAVGDTHGAYQVRMPLAGVDASVASFFMSGAAFSTPVVLVGLGLFVFLLRMLVTKPIASVVAVVQDIAQGEGDLTKRLNVDRNDEIGKLSHWFDRFLDNIHGIISQVSGATSEVSAAATEIAASSEEMAHGLEHQRTQTGQVSAAVEEMSGSVREVAAKSNEAVEIVR
ncbi:MAG: methyl-accepting chemotaxis protein, partial [Planctomycetota bacterium]